MLAVAKARDFTRFRAALASRGLNRLAYLPALRGLVRLILGAGAFCYPVTVLRVVYPERRGAVTRSRDRPSHERSRVCQGQI